MRSQSRVIQALGALAFVVGLVGYAFFGWRFGDGADSPVALVFALAATLRNRR